MSWSERLLLIDRRIIFLFVAVAVALPIIFNWVMPIFVITPEVMGVFDAIDALPPRAGILIVFDYEPATTPELDPMAEAIFRHCFKKDLRVVCTTLYSNAPGIIEGLLTRLGDEYNKKKEIDYTNLGFRAGAYSVVLSMVDGVKSTFQKNYYDHPTQDLPVLEDLNKLRDFSYLMCLHDDSTVQTWVTYAFERTGIPIGSGCTAVMATGSYPLMQAGQITGIIGGLKGAAEYEAKLGYKGDAHRGMFSQSVVHILIIIMIGLGNLGHFLGKRRDRAKRRLVSARM